MSKVDLTINFWKSKLLDLTKRNRALNYKPTKVSTVTIADEYSVEIFRLLCLQGKELKFKSAPDNRGEPKAATSRTRSQAHDDSEIGTFEGGDEVEDALLAQDFQPYDATALASKYTDLYLQTSSTAEKLDKSLRRLEEQARLSLEEQGVNSLFLTLGMLHYGDTAASAEFYRAPLILIPVELVRSSARTGHTLKKTDDEVIVNPSLTEHLKRTSGIIIPDIPDSGMMSEEYDVHDFFLKTEKAIKDQVGWSVKDQISLGLFSFQKLVIYKDLERNAKRMGTHSIIHQIITREVDDYGGLPDEVRDLDLDKEFAPEHGGHVVDADASQLRALAAVAKQNNLVLEGPPGTGKSQTITNLIAQALYMGKSVLFVAEKMAALEVVHRRLTDLGLNEFCLELHSSKANKRSVMHEIGSSLSSSLQRPNSNSVTSERLPDVRRTLTDYIVAVHTKYGSLGQSPYEAVGELTSVLEAPKVPLQRDIFAYTHDEILSAMRDTEDLAVIVSTLDVPPRDHPWRDSERTFYSEHVIDEVANICAHLITALSDLLANSQQVETLGLPQMRTLADIDLVSAISDVLAKSPGAPIHVLKNPEWNTPPPDAMALIDSIKRIAKLKQKLLMDFAPEVTEYDPQDDIAFIEQKSSGFFSFLAILSGRYRSIKKRWLAYRLPHYDSSLLEQASDLTTAVEMHRERKTFLTRESRGSLLFGLLWNGLDTDPTSLENYVSWVMDFRRLFVEHGLRENTIATASKASPDLRLVQELQARTAEIRTVLEKLVSLAAFPAGYFDSLEIVAIQSRIVELRDHLTLAPRWAQFESARQKVQNGAAGELLSRAIDSEISFEAIPPVFKRAFYQRWLSQVIEERPALQAFHTLTHEERIREFRVLDAEVLKNNRSLLIGKLRGLLQDKLRTHEIQSGMRFLRGQLAKQRNIAPLRTTMKHSLAAIRAIKPCFMMSPLTVSQLLEDEGGKFDLLIFDEASQLRTEDSICSILRAKQIVVVGDPKQLPPTNFFAVQSGQVNVTMGEDGMPLYEDTQSILEEATAAGVARSRLKWHYRSAHESLITFSNAKFYDSELYTFPSVEIDSVDSGLHFHLVTDGVYEGKGLNHREAAAVALAVVEQYKAEPHLSVGVGTFNVAQQLAIQDELEHLRRNDPSIEPFFDKNQFEPLFVKNLENIQGDERDVIFLSVTYGRTEDGKLRYNLGPLNGKNGWRRLNVLTTRARKLMRVYSSIRSDDINLNETASIGAQLLKDFLGYAELKNIDILSVPTSPVHGALFEAAVATALTERGFTLARNIGVCGYKIDLAIIDEDIPGRFICGIECDGVAYFASETARDRDRLRQQVLESHGWDIHRVWSTDWYKDREGQIDRLSNLISISKRKAESAGLKRFASKGRPMIDEDKTQESDSAAVLEFGLSVEEVEYSRPVANAYQVAAEKDPYGRSNLLDAPAQNVCNEILAVVNCEAPLHSKDLATRVAGIWGQNPGKNIVQRIEMLVRHLASSGHLQIRGEFIWNRTGTYSVRSRAGTNIPSERIAPEEMREAILIVLRAGNEFTHTDLIREVRALLGFNRTGAKLQETIAGMIETMLADGTIGEGRIGIAIRD